MHMALMRPDPTFYPSPGMAMQAPAEQLAYVTLLNVGGNGKKDAMGVIDIAPGSPEYGRLVGQVDFPHGDNELHHFGWNACSACLCPQNPHPHMERRYLVCRLLLEKKKKQMSKEPKLSDTTLATSILQQKYTQIATNSAVVACTY